MRIAFFLLLSLVAHKQQPPAIQPLTIGDTVPAVHLPNIINYSSSSASLSAFKGKSIIICFFATWCTSCPGSFRLMDSLQAQHGQDLQVLMVSTKNSGDDINKINTFLQKHHAANGKPYTLPVVYNDTALQRLFPFKFISHFVWINAAGRVAAITSIKELTKENTQNFMAGKPLSLPVKKDVADYNPKEPLLVNGNGGEHQNLLFRTTLTGFLPGMGKGNKRYSDSLLQKFTYINQNLLALYQQAFGFAANRLLINIKDTTLYNQLFGPGSAKKNNSFSYEITATLSMPLPQLKSKMGAELNRYFGLNGRMEKRGVKAYVITCNGKIKGTKAAKTVTLKNIVNALNNYPVTTIPKPIVINECNEDVMLDASLYSMVNDWPALQKVLEAHGLKIRTRHRQLDMFILSD